MSNKLSFDKPIFALAPLAGYTDLPFRSVVKKFGADLSVSEMISSNALVHNSAKSIHMLQKSPNETPYSVQIAGAEVDVVRGAIEYLNGVDGIDIVDLNCGCPVPKIVSHGSGSSLLLNLPLMGSIIRTIKDTSNKAQTSVKVRLGFEKKNHIEIAKVVEDSGADFIAVHGRTRAGKFQSKVDYDAIKEIKKSISIPVIANGDIDSYEKAKWVLEHTECDGVMIGRGAIGKPWLFYQLKHGNAFVDAKLKHSVIMEHFDSMIEFYGAYGAILFRKHIHTYSKGYRGASMLREKVNKIEDIAIYRELIDDFFKNSEMMVC